MLPIRWNAVALDDLETIIAYIAQFNLNAAEALQDRIEKLVVALSEHPYLFRPGRVSGTRELVAHPNYIVVYRVRDDHIEIANVMHARQQYPLLKR